MNTFEPYKTFRFDTFNFNATGYREYGDGALLSEGRVDVFVLCKMRKNGVIKVYLINNSLTNKILSEFEFDLLLVLEDSMQLAIFPQNTNVDDALFSCLKPTVPYTRECKQFAPNEPIMGHIFTKNMSIVKITFKMIEPGRVVEFY